MFWLYLPQDVHEFTFNFNTVIFSSGICALRYASGKLKMATHIDSCASMIIMINRASKDIAVEDASFLGIYHLYGLPYAHVPPFIYPHLFPFIRFIALSAPIFVTL